MTWSTRLSASNYNQNIVHCNAIRQDTSNQQLHRKFNSPWLKYSRNQRVIVTASSVPGENEFNVKTALQTLMEISTNGILHVQYSSRWVYNSTDPEKDGRTYHYYPSWSFHLYRNIMKSGEMKHEMT